MGPATMARKRTKATADRAKPAADRPATAVTLRGGPEWKAWIVAGTSSVERTSPSSLIPQSSIN